MGLWQERRWGEYLTAVATAGLLPVTVGEVAARVTVLRVAALSFEIAVFVWLVWAKHLFGARGGRRRRFGPGTTSPFDAPPLVLPASASSPPSGSSPRCRHTSWLTPWKPDIGG